MRKKGFTLIELLAVLVLLSIITLIAVPNVIGIIENNKKATYISDAKRFASLAEAFVHTNTFVTKPTNNTRILKIMLGSLDTTDFTKSPDGYDYNFSRSYVTVRYNNKKLEYFVHLVSVHPTNSTKSRGVRLVKIDELNKSTRFTKVVENISDPAQSEMFNIMFGSTTSKTVDLF